MRKIFQFCAIASFVVFAFLICNSCGKSEDTIVTYTVFFNSNNGCNIPSQIVSCNSTAEEPVAPIRTGYTFADWYSDLALTLIWDFSTLITEDITLYAKWHTNPIVTFYSNGGTDVTSQIIGYNTAILEPISPTKSGYLFVGWYSDSSLMQEWVFNTIIIEDTTLYAKWMSTSGEVPDMEIGNAW